MSLRFSLLAGVCAVSFAATPAIAAKASTAGRLDALERAMAAQQAQIEGQQRTIDAQAAEIARLRSEAAQTASQAAQAAPVAEAVQQQGAQIEALQSASENQKLADADKPRLTYNVGRLSLATADGRNTIAVRALVQGDAAFYFQDQEGPLATDFRRGSNGAAPNRETNAARDLSNGAYFRRARLGVEGTFNRDWGYRLMLELAGSGTEGPARINDAWISYTGFAPFTIQAGAFSPPANMDDGTSPEDTIFPERATPSELSRTMGGADGRLALMARFGTPRWMGALSFTGRTVNDAEVFDTQAAVVGRLGHLLFTSDDWNVHVGASGTYVIGPPDQGSSATSNRHGLRFRDRPEIRVDSTRLIDTGTIDAAHAWVTGLEFGAQYRNVYVQAEHFWYGVERHSPSTLSDPRFDGFYIQGSWVLTGEPRRYNAANGSWQNPRPRLPVSSGGGLGAFELAARFSKMDLDYHAGVFGAATPSDGVRGGVQEIVSLGLNWYPTANLKFSLDYMHIDVDRLNPGAAAFGPAPATPPAGVQIGQDLDVLTARTQFSF